MLGLNPPGATVLLFVLGASAGLAATLDNGSLDGAPYAVAVPDAGHWNHGVLLLAHDRRNETLPPLALDPMDSPFCRTLVDEGWIVASSGYPRNGVVIADAVKSLDALRTYLGEHYGSVQRTLVLGEGLGGFVAALMAERPVNLVTGAIAIDPPLTAHEANQPQGLSLDPKIPLLLVATQKRPLAEATAYTISKMPRPAEDPRPALASVARDGRDNVNEGERLNAVRVLNAWLDFGPNALPQTVPNKPYCDITAAPPARPARVVPNPDTGGFTAHVLAVNPLNGSLQLDARPEDFDQVSIKARGYFEITFTSEAVRVLRAEKGARLKAGDWVAYDDADGYVTLERHDEDKAPAAEVEPGSPIKISPYVATVP